MRLPARGGTPTAFAQLDVHPGGIVALRDGFVVTAHGTPFTQAPAFTATNQILVLDSGGAVRARVAVPEAQFLNGMVIAPGGGVLIADAMAGIIWRFDPTAGALTEWLRHEKLAPDPAATAIFAGANGLKIGNGALYISNSSRGAIYRLGLSAAGEPVGAPELFARTGPVDDFAIDSDGAIYAATHGAVLLRLTPQGAVETLLAEGCDGCTSVALAGEGRRLIVLTTGNLLEGGDAPARVLSVTLERLAASEPPLQH
jgi:sugar lactone lactonase YvrE